MADADPRPDSEGAGAPSSPPGRPKWVRTFAIVAGVVIVILVAAMIISGGEHGPGRHLPGGNNPEGHTAPAQHSP
jgi:hypothetical protein